MRVEDPGDTKLTTCDNGRAPATRVAWWSLSWATGVGVPMCVVRQGVGKRHQYKACCDMLENRVVESVSSSVSRIRLIPKAIKNKHSS